MPSFRKAFFIGTLLSALALSPILADTARAQILPTNSAEQGPQEISDEEINSFLFKIDEETRGKVKTISAKAAHDIFIPILFGVGLDGVENSWGDARSGGRRHEGTDILVPRGELVITPTEAVVIEVGYDKKGGNFVLTANPGGEQFYYAHLDRIADTLTSGDVLVPGDVIGYIGSTGNARSPHLHLGIYYKGKAINPFPRITQELPLDRKLDILENNIKKSNIRYAEVISILDKHTDLLEAKGLTDTVVPYTIALLIEHKDVLSAAKQLDGAIGMGSEGNGVRLLQELLAKADSGPAARALARKGMTGYFGSYTHNALVEYQKAQSITPAQGRFGPVTKSHVINMLWRDVIPGVVAAQATPKATVLSDVPTSAPIASVSRDLKVGSSGNDVRLLQQFLIDANSGLAAEALASAGVTGYFGETTRSALAEYQALSGTPPARGYFGAVTRAQLQ